MASNMGPVTSFPWSGLLSVKVRTLEERWISTKGVEDALGGGGLDMEGRLYTEVGGGLVGDGDKAKKAEKISPQKAQRSHRVRGEEWTRNQARTWWSR